MVEDPIVSRQIAGFQIQDRGGVARSRLTDDTAAINRMISLAKQQLAIIDRVATR